MPDIETLLTTLNLRLQFLYKCRRVKEGGKNLINAEKFLKKKIKRRKEKSDLLRIPMPQTLGIGLRKLNDLTFKADSTRKANHKASTIRISMHNIYLSIPQESICHPLNVMSISILICPLMSQEKLIFK